jgi:hypothetical protein
MLCLDIIGLVGIYYICKKDAPAFVPLFVLYIVFLFFGYGLFGTLSPCKTDIVKQCEIITSMYNDYAGTVVYKDINNKDANIVYNTINGVGLIKSGKFKMIVTYDENHFGGVVIDSIKYSIVENKDMKDIKVEK